MIKLENAIKEFRKESYFHRRAAEASHIPETTAAHLTYAEEYKQLADWLDDYKELTSCARMESLNEKPSLEWQVVDDQLKFKEDLDARDLESIIDLIAESDIDRYIENGTVYISQKDLFRFLSGEDKDKDENVIEFEPGDAVCYPDELGLHGTALKASNDSLYVLAITFNRPTLSKWPLSQVKKLDEKPSSITRSLFKQLVKCIKEEED